MINKIKAGVYNKVPLLLGSIIVCTLVYTLNACSLLLPRSVLDSDTDDITTESRTVGKYQVNIKPLDKAAVIHNNKDDYVYLIGNRDQIIVTVWGHPEFSSLSGFANNDSPNLLNNTTNIPIGASSANNVYTVDENGKIYLPLLGGVTVVDKTISQVRTQITKKVSEYVVNPQVSVTLNAYRSKRIYIVGEVNQATVYYLNDVPVDLAQALTMAGWINLSTANVKEIYVLRQGKENNIELYHLDVATPTALVFASQFTLKASDIVFVSTAGLAQFDRVMTHFVSAATVIWYTRTTIDPTNTLTIFQSQQQ